MKFWRTRLVMTWLRPERRRGRRRWWVCKERLNGNCLRGGRRSTRHHPRCNSRISNWSQHGVKCSLHFPERPCKNFVFPASLSGQIPREKREKDLLGRPFPSIGFFKYTFMIASWASLAWRPLFCTHALHFQTSTNRASTKTTIRIPSKYEEQVRTVSHEWA